MKRKEERRARKEDIQGYETMSIDQYIYAELDEERGVVIIEGEFRICAKGSNWHSRIVKIRKPFEIPIGRFDVNREEDR